MSSASFPSSSYESNHSTDIVTERLEDVSSWFLMGSPYPVLGITVLYLYIVISFAPNWMRSRPAYNLKGLVVAYNAFLVAFNLWIVVKVLRNSSVDYFTNSWCLPMHMTRHHTLRHEMNKLAWFYFISKVIELCDTVLFRLRKKDNQVSFLHVFHHSSVLVFVWVQIKYFQSEQAILAAFVNTCVHVIMYAYYLVAALGPQYQKYIWWKKYLTWIQLFQFCFILFYNCAVLVYDCQLQKIMTYMQLVQYGQFLFLFAMFYKSTYSAKTTKMKYHVNGNKCK